MKTIAILSLSFFTVLTGALLAPALPMIQASYPGVAAFWLQALMTVPSLAFLVMLPLLPRLPGTKKQQVLAGLAVYLIGGLLPVLPLAFGGLLAARFLSGIGMSLFAGPAVSLIGDHYPPHARRRLLGDAAAVTSAGTITAVSAAGAIAARDWHWVFGLYGLAVVPLLLIAFFLPPQVSVPTAHRVFHLTPALVGNYVLIAAWNALYFVLPTTLPFYLQTVLHDPAALHAGLALAGVSLIGLGLNVNYARLPNTILGKTVVSFAVLTVAGGALVPAQWPLVAVALLAAGIGVGLAMPLFNERIVALTPGDDRDHALAVGSAMIFAGQLLSPFVFSALASTWRLALMAQLAAFIGSVVLWQGCHRRRD